MEQPTETIEDRIKQLVEAGNRLEAAAVYADRKHVSFQQAREYIDETFPIEEYPVKPPPPIANNTSDEGSTGGMVLGCLVAIVIVVLLIAIGIAIKWAILRHFYPQYPTYLSFIKSWIWVKPTLYSVGGLLLLFLIMRIFKK